MVTQQRPVVMPWETPKGRRPTRVERDELIHIDTLRLVRADGLPEYKVYTDDGCSAAPSCLACPFDACRFDTAGDEYGDNHYGHYPDTMRRAQKARTLQETGLTLAKIGVEMGVGKRSVLRLLRIARGEPTT